MSDWITDRLPTEADSDRYGYVWVTDQYGRVGRMPWNGVTYSLPWMPITSPEPYVKPKRWLVESVKYSCYGSTEWRVRDTKTDMLLNLKIDTYEQARKFADFLNEVMP